MFYFFNSIYVVKVCLLRAKRHITRGIKGLGGGETLYRHLLGHIPYQQICCVGDEICIEQVDVTN